MEPTLEYIVRNDGEYKFKSEVVQFCQTLEAFFTEVTVNTDNLKKTFSTGMQKMAVGLIGLSDDLEFDSTELMESLNPVAGLLDTVKEAEVGVEDTIQMMIDKYVSLIISSPQAYINPPPGDAETVNLTFGTPQPVSNPTPTTETETTE